MKVISASPEDTQHCAREVLERIFADSGKNTAAASVVAPLSGDLGSGKTAFVQALAKALGVDERVTSPTFIIEKIYELKDGSRFSHLIHIDAYRLDGGAKELIHLGWNDIVADPRNLICIEWPEKVSGIIPAEAIQFSFRFIDDHTREICLPDNLIQ